MADVVQKDYLALEQKLWDVITEADGLYTHTGHVAAQKLWERIVAARNQFHKEAKSLGYDMPDR